MKKARTKKCTGGRPAPVCRYARPEFKPLSSPGNGDRKGRGSGLLADCTGGTRRSHRR